MPVKILWFHLKDSKGVVDLEWEPKQDGVTTIGGKSGQGKTAALDNIAWLLGGDRYKPEKAQRDGAGYPDLDVTLSNGLRVTRKGKRSSLKVTDPNKKLGNQSLLREFVGTFALDAPKFLRLNGKEKAEALLNIIGVGDELRRLDKLCEETYADREAHGRITIQKEKYAAELPDFKDSELPSEEVSANALIEEIRKVDATNAENGVQRDRLSRLTANVIAHDNAAGSMQRMRSEEHSDGRLRIEDAEAKLEEAKRDLLETESRHLQSIKTEEAELKSLESDRDEIAEVVTHLLDQPTDALQRQLTACEETNARVRANATKKAAVAEAKQYKNEREVKTGELEDYRGQRIALLDNADLPLPGLGVASGELTYNGLPWDSLSTSDGMKVAVAISAAEKPECGFTLIDGMETMDDETFGEFCDDMEAKGLQVIGTRVSTGDECSFLVQEGIVKGAE